eukprot:NODE_659_length_4968_cov_0.490655.p6 type:complete len:105 gc:universal NODE_659_length_4968_cov_0.490655:172-486(+)
MLLRIILSIAYDRSRDVKPNNSAPVMGDSILFTKSEISTLHRYGPSCAFKIFLISSFSFVGPRYNKVSRRPGLKRLGSIKSSLLVAPMTMTPGTLEISSISFKS